MYAIYQQIILAILAHLQAIWVATSLFIYVAAANMPKPGVKWDKSAMYSWFYDTIQTVLPMNRGSHQLIQTPQLLVSSQSDGEQPKAGTPKQIIKTPQMTVSLEANSSEPETSKKEGSPTQADIPMPPRYGVK